MSRFRILVVGGYGFFGRRLVERLTLHSGLHVQIGGRLFRRWGSDAGAMHVTVNGREAGGSVVTKTWQLVATGGHGPYVPTLAAAALVRKLREGHFTAGAFPRIGLLTLADFAREMDGLAIRTEVVG